VTPWSPRLRLARPAPALSPSDFIGESVRSIVADIDDEPVGGIPGTTYDCNGTGLAPNHLGLAGKGNPGASTCAQPL
jgi:hypothetical protein